MSSLSAMLGTSAAGAMATATASTASASPSVLAGGLLLGGGVLAYRLSRSPRPNVGPQSLGHGGLGSLFKWLSRPRPRSPSELIVFGRSRPRPAWLDTAPGLFDQTDPAVIPYTSIKGENCRAGVPPLRRHHAYAESRALESMLESVRWLQHVRGLKTWNDEGKAIVPEITAQGVLIERQERNGNIIDLIAVGLTAPLTAEEYRQAIAAKFNFYKSRWSDRPYHLAKGWLWSNYDFKDPRSGQMPLFGIKIASFAVQARSVANPFAPPATEKGSAQFAWVDELRASETARLGSLHPSGAGVPLGLFRVRDWKEGDNRAGVVATRWNGRDGEHRVIVGPPGSGKFTSAIAPLLLSADAASVIAFDVANGEATKVTARHRATLGPVNVLDPFGLSGVPSGGLNPLDVLQSAGENMPEIAYRLADAIFIPSGKNSGTDGYFNENARDCLASFLMHLATWDGERRKTLSRLREIIRAPLFEYDDNGGPVAASVLNDMIANPACGGIISDNARSLVAAICSGADKSVYYIAQTLKSNTSFLDLPTVQRVTERTTLDARELRQRIGSLFVVVPEHQLKTVGRWLRLVYASLSETFRAPGGKVPLHFVIDEFPALGSFSRVSEDMALVRKYGVSYHIIVQSLVQLKNLYGDGWETFMATSRYKQFLGVNDHVTGQWLSVQLGKTTRAATSDSVNRSTAGGGGSSSKSWAGVDLLSPDELARLPRHEAVVLVENCNPLRLRKLHYFESDYFKGRASPGPK